MTDPQWYGPLLTPWGLGVLGLCIGSFLNVVAHRLPLMLERRWRSDSAELLQVELPEAGPDIGLARPASRCPHCGHGIRWYENIPVISWVALRGRCSACKAPIALRYPLVELLCGALFAALSWRLGAEPATLPWCGFAAVLLGLALIDWDTTLLPDDMTLPLLWAGLIVSALGWSALPLPDAVWGAVGGYLSLWIVYQLFKRVTGKEGMGYGDFKLLAAIGAWLGWQALLPVILASSLVGAVVGIIMKIAGALREGRFVPFGPFLAGAGILVLLIGVAPILDWLRWM
jgi:leader peptidase (prepilin peptidase)/N-methyltransferase